MKNRKVLCILLSLTLLLGMTVPGTLALSVDTATADSTDSTTTTQATTSTASETIESDATAEDSDVVSTVDETVDTIAPDGSVEITEIGEPCEECGQVGGHTETCSRNTPVCNCEATEEEKADPNFIHKEGCPLYVVPESTENDLYTRLMAATTPEEFLSIVNGLSSEEAAAFEKSLSGEQIQALQAHLQAISPVEDPVPPKTVVFTAAGPFMPPVNVSASKWSLRRAIASSGVTADNGLEISKEVLRANDDGSYTIRLEAYTTGTVVTSTKTVPVDIVLVLDQSGSMAYDFNGNSTKDIKASRQYAMKQAVNNFISSVAEKYTEDADHRISIVTFGTNASTLQGWTDVNDAGKTTLQDKINGLNSPSGATNVSAGMGQAEALMGSGYGYTGKNIQRQKVVIVFTDGVPTTSTDFDTGVATGAISSAKKLKDGSATVYTVGIFNGADPTQLHGEKFDRVEDLIGLVKDDPCYGNVGEYWGYTNLLAWSTGGAAETIIRGLDIAATNRFLNYLSSNFGAATEIGIENYSSGLLGGQAWRITKNFTRTASSYYLTANDSNSLNSIFQTISDNIQTANIDLGAETLVKDTVSKYFDLPSDASEIKLYTADAKADGTFGNADQARGVTASIKNGVVSVTGFDYNANFVSKTPKSDGTYGKKLIIEFDVTPKDGFIGGNDVPTNDWKNSAVYDKGGNEIEKFADEDTTPTVNVPIKEPVFDTSEKTIYQGNSTSVAGLYSVPDTTDWQYDYVYVDVVVGGIEGESVSPSDCTDYTVTVTYKPKTEGTGSVGTPNNMDGKSKSDTAKIHVLKPAVTATINDVQKYYGESYTLGDDANGSISAEWKDANGHTGIPAAEGTVPYTGDNLTLVYSTTTEFTGSVPKHDFDVTVKVMNGSKVITDATITTTCAVAGSSCQPETNGVYTVHVKTCALTIMKSGGAAGEPYVFKVMKDNVEYTQVTIVGNNSVTICELPVGTYTIEEDTGWSWRYNPTYGEGVTLSNTAATGTITCTNEQKNPYWLNGFSGVVKNIFSVTSK